MNRSASTPQQLVIKPVMSPYRQRHSSVSAEDTVLLRKKFEFQSPVDQQGMVVVKVDDTTYEETLRSEAGETEPSQGEDLVTKKFERQAESGPWVPEDEDDLLPTPLTSNRESCPTPREGEDSPAPVVSRMAPNLHEISRTLAQKAQELAMFAEMQQAAPPAVQYLPSVAGTPSPGYIQVVEENEALRKRVRELESRAPVMAVTGAPRCTSLIKVRDAVVGVKKMLWEERVRVMKMREEWTSACGDVTQQVVSALGRTEKLYTAAEIERKNLHQKLQEARGTIRVIARVRPLLNGERDSCVVTRGDFLHLERHNGQLSTFTFDSVLPENSTQADLYEELKSIPQSVLDGHNCCVLAYGQTGSGKTHTMLGDCGATASLLSDICNTMRRREQTGGYQYRLFVSISEVYNDTVRDLFTHQKIDTFQGEYFGTEEEVVEPGRDISRLLVTGENERASGVSNLNARSSRSHCAILARVEGVNSVTGVAVQGQVYMVDLAGSERIPSTSLSHQGASQTFLASTGLLKETQHINKSLSSLGDVIRALATGNPHIPYRNSKLTNLLKPCLKRGSKVVLITTLSPAAVAAPESLCTLQFASRAKTVHLNESKGPRSPRPVVSSGRHRSLQPARQLRSRSAPNIWEC